MEQKKYGLITSITMITGIVIGSGVFFKSDDVLKYTNGNMLLGIIVFVVAAIAIVFGSLTISQLAARTDTPGGVIGYAEHFVNKQTAGAIGWFQMFLYFGPLTAVVSWVAGLYLCQLFGIEATHTNSTLLGLVALLAIYLINTVSAVLGGAFQNAAMLIKLIPLIMIAVLGMIFGNNIEIVKQDIQTFSHAASASAWTAAFAPIAFSYDGWSVATTVCHKIKDSKRNLPIAMMIAPLVVLACYLLYFVGITSYLGAETVMAQGNESVYLAANQMFGAFGGRLILIFVVISVLGTLNGIVLAYIQLPYSLALHQMIPFGKVFQKTSEKTGGMPFGSAAFACLLSLIWLFIHYMTLVYNLTGDVSEVPVCLTYGIFCILYVVVMRLKRKGEIKSRFMGYIVPLLAMVGAVIIIGGTVSHQFFGTFTVLAIVICAAGYGYTAYNK